MPYTVHCHFQVFPELTSALMDTRNSGWHMDNHYVIRFPLNGFCKLNSIQVIQRLLNNSFNVVASSGGGVEGQQFSEYVFAKNCKPIRWRVSHSHWLLNWGDARVEYSDWSLCVLAGMDIGRRAVTDDRSLRWSSTSSRSAPLLWRVAAERTRLWNDEWAWNHFHFVCAFGHPFVDTDG